MDNQKDVRRTYRARRHIQPMNMEHFAEGFMKAALHAHERMKERLHLPEANVDNLQKAVDKMWYSHGRKKLNNAFYHVKLKDHKNNVLGIVALKRVGTHPYASRLVVSTALKPEMRYKGDDISHFFDLQMKGDYVSAEPEKFKGLPPVPNNAKNR